MPIRSIPVDDITEEDLLRLKEAAVPERQDFDYKRDSYGRSDADKVEFLADVSSFANTAGGHIVIGMAEDGGRPTELVGLEGNVDEEKQRLEAIAHSGLEPPILGLRMASVPLSGDKHAIVIRVPRSWNPPHRVVAYGRNRFWARNSAGKYEPKVDQLRQLFLTAPALADRVRDFRLDRITKIAAGETPVRLIDRNCLVLHVVPFESLDGTFRYDVKDLINRWTEFTPITPDGGGMDWRINLDGLVTLSGMDDHGKCKTYTQIWRTGLIESVRAGIIVEDQNGNSGVSAITQERNLIYALTNHLHVARKISLPLPLVVMVSLIGVNSAYLGVKKRYANFTSNVFDRDMVHASAIDVDAFPASAAEVARHLRRAFDEIANAANLPESPHFHENGDWIGTV